MTIENNNQQPDSQAPDGAPATGTTGADASADDRVQKALDQRRALGQRLDETLDQNRVLREKLEALEAAKLPPQEKPKAKPVPDGAPEWFSAAMAPLTDRLAELEQMNSARARDGIVDSILQKVPDGNRDNARVMIAGLEATKKIDLASPTAIADVIELLSSTPVMLDPNRGSLPSAPQQRADGSLDFSQYGHPDEIPEGFLGQAMQDPDTFKRMLAGTTGGSDRATDGYNI